MLLDRVYAKTVWSMCAKQASPCAPTCDTSEQCFSKKANFSLRACSSVGGPSSRGSERRSSCIKPCSAGRTVDMELLAMACLVQAGLGFAHACRRLQPASIVCMRVRQACCLLRDAGPCPHRHQLHMADSDASAPASCSPALHLEIAGPLQRATAFRGQGASTSATLPAGLQRDYSKHAAVS